VNFFNLIKNMLQSAAGRAFSSVLMLVSVFFSVFSAFPLLLTYFSEGRKKGLYVIMFACLFTYILGSWQFAVFYLLVVGLVSVLIAEIIKIKTSFPKTIFLVTTITCIFYTLILLVVSYINSSGVVDYLSLHAGSAVVFMNTNFPDLIRQVLVDSGMSEQEFIKHIVIQMPSTAVLTLLIFILVNTLMISSFNPDSQKFLKLDKLQTFKMSESFIWATIVAGALYLYSSSGYNTSILLEATARMIFYALMGFYFLYGMLISYVVINIKISSQFLRILLFSVLIVFAYIFVTAIGFFDTWFNFRKYFKKGEEL
jgi:hypothetical protein